MMGSKDGVPVGSRELYLYKPPLNSWTWGKPDKTFDLPAYHLWILSIHLTRYLTVFYRSSSSRAPPPLANCLSSTALSDTEAEDRLEPVLSFPDGFNMLLLPGNASEAKAKPLHSRYVLFWVKREEMLEQWARRSFNLLSQLGSTGIPNFLVICELDFLSTLLSHSLLITSSSESAPLHPGLRFIVGWCHWFRAPGPSPMKKEAVAQPCRVGESLLGEDDFPHACTEPPLRGLRERKWLPSQLMPLREITWFTVLKQWVSFFDILM